MSPATGPAEARGDDRVVAIGASTGGPEALRAILLDTLEHATRAG